MYSTATTGTECTQAAILAVYNRGAEGEEGLFDWESLQQKVE